MTFIVNQEGIIYEKDLGVITTRTVEKMKIFNPDNTWKKGKGDITAARQITGFSIRAGQLISKKTKYMILVFW